MKLHLVSVVFAATLFRAALPATHAEAGEETSDAAKRIKSPALIIAQVLQDADPDKDEDEDTAPSKRSPSPRKQTLKADPPTLPEWTPPVPQFKPDGPVSKRKIDGEVRIAQTGISPLTPAELGDAWETAKTAEFMRSRNNLTVNDKIIVKVALTDYYEPKEEVHLEAVRGPKDKITHVTIYSPLPKSTVRDK